MEVITLGQEAPAPLRPAQRLPFQPGLVRRVTDAERQELTKIGWQDGDPVPGNLAEAIESLRAGDDRQLSAELSALAARPGLAFDEARVPSVDSLPPAGQAELRRKMAEMQAVAATFPDQPAFSTVPGLAEAVAAAVGPRAEPAEVREPQPPAAPPAGSTTGLAPAPTHCHHCGWELANRAVPEPSDEEKRQYLTACLVGDRFDRRAELLGGAVTVTFRELRAAEASRVFDQVNGEFSASVDLSNYMARVATYQMVLAIRSIEFSGRRRIELPDLDRLPVAAGEAPLPKLLRLVQETAIVSESLWRVVIEAYRGFRSVLARLEANATTPGFYPEIPGPA